MLRTHFRPAVLLTAALVTLAVMTVPASASGSCGTPVYVHQRAHGHQDHHRHRYLGHSGHQRVYRFHRNRDDHYERRRVFHRAGHHRYKAHRGHSYRHHRYKHAYRHGYRRGGCDD